MADESAQTDMMEGAADATPETASVETAAADAAPETADTSPMESASESVETAAEGAAEDAPAEQPEEQPESAPEAAPESEPTLLEQTANPGKDDEAKTGSEDAEKSEAKAEADADEKAEAEAKSDDDDKVDADAKTEDDVATEEKAASEDSEADAEPEAPALESIEYKYELPETLQMDDAMREQTHAAFDAFRADPANPQPLIDLHNDAMQQHAEAMRQEQWDVFNNTRKEWRDQVLADNEIGGSGHQTAMQAIARMRDRFASSANPDTKQYDAELQAFDGMLRATGVGDHPVFLKMMHRVAQLYDEPPMGPTNVTPAPQPTGANVLYDNPRSQTRQ